MSEIRISQGTQAVVLLGLVGAILAAVAAQLPELKRYLKIRAM